MKRYCDEWNWVRKLNQDRVSALLARGYECLKNADLGNASAFFDEALQVDFERGEVLFALKCAEFWKEGLVEISKIASPLGKGDFTLTRWKSFQQFLSRISGDFEMATYAFKRMAFSVALDAYLSIPEPEQTRLGAEFDFRVGRCRKALGDYETAQRHLERAAKSKREDARYLAELADCHGLSGESDISAALFREAFFIAPDKIELDLLESDLIRMLADKTRAAGHKGNETAEWLPVFGELSGALAAARELTTSESSRLNSSMFRLENDLRENPSAAAAIRPRLLNRYFWILDHYKATGVENARMDKIVQKIRQLDEDIFQQSVS